ncbi:MAG: carboxypeptidase regulatory-like domain-containing protein [Bryobacteraceae bacterium]
MTGLVVDSSKAVVAGVRIGVRNTDTNIEQTIQTNESGLFAITGLAPGVYELTASKPGFETYRKSQIVLETGQRLRDDIVLRVGAVSTTVEVTAEAAPLNTEDGAMKGAVIGQQEIQEVPLNGRDFTDIALLVPGVQRLAEGAAGSGMTVNGARGDNTNFYLDGFNDRSARGAAAQLRPNLDALEEFKMEVSGFSAQYGKLAGGIMNMVLKSGTNQPHGTVFEYLRNGVLDARPFFDPVKYPLHRNQFGATVSGPVVLPAIYNGHDKTFFMVSWESYRETSKATTLNNVPTPAQRAGDFSGMVNNRGQRLTVADPYAGNAPFPGNTIPASRFSPVAVRMMEFFPQPNYISIGNNYQAAATRWSNWTSVVGKGDHRFSEKDSISVRYGYRWNSSNSPFAGTNLGTFANVGDDGRSLGGITHTHLFSPALINEFRVGFSRNALNEHIDDSQGQPDAAQLGMAGSATDPALAGFPKVNVTNYAGLGFAVNDPLAYYATDYQTGDVLTWIKGKHILKFGADVSLGQYDQPYYNNSRGTLTTNGVWTGAGNASNGDAFADLLLGLVSSSSITAVPTRCYLRWRSYGGFVNDDFKATPNLTLNLGLRYEINPPPHDKHGRMINFVPELNKIIIASDKTIPDLDQLLKRSNLTGRVGLAGQYGLPDSLVFTDYNNFSPRLGFAWRPGGTRRSVIRGGYGWFYSGSMLSDIRYDLGTSFPFAVNYNFNRLSSDPNALTLANPWPLALAALGGVNTSNGFQTHAPVGYLQTYSLTVERDLGRGNILEIGYVGSKGTHLGRKYDINMPYRSIENYMAYGTAFPVNYPGLNTINYYDFGSNSIYGAGQIMLRKRGGRGLFYRLAYTWSKSLDTTSQISGSSSGGVSGALDARNLGLERGRSDSDKGHVFTAVFNYTPPIGRGKPLLHNARKIVNGVFGGWQLSGTVTASTGPPFTIQDSSVNASIGESTRPNRIASGKETSGTGRRGLGYRWYDPGAFVGVAGCASRTSCLPDRYGFLPFSPGNSGRNILDAPGMFVTNANLMKNIQLGEGRRIQVRWESFNAFNTPNFRLPNRNFDANAAGIITGVQSPRQMQFGLKYIF